MVEVLSLATGQILFSAVSDDFLGENKMATEKETHNTLNNAIKTEAHKVSEAPSEKRLSHYDPHIIPAETVARETREGEGFGYVDHDLKTSEHVHTRDGYTVDQEGLINNYAIEVPMYINEPGDLAEEEAAIAQQRAADLHALARDENGNLTPKNNWRHKGPGVI